ncbi:MAG: hypothetical protein MUD15_08745 [Desulfobacterota bacterium]|jgi:hypothetical protein|nr:hypothetical protein [Thermodesulfobacteriota bacterium]
MTEVIMKNTLKTAWLSLFLLSLPYGCPSNAVLFPMMGAGQVQNAMDLGLSSTPYLVYSNTGLDKINEVCETTKQRVSIEDTYQSAYGKNLEDLLPDGDSGQTFKTMQDASRYLQKILKDKGEPKPEEFILTSIETARKKGYILVAVVQRPRAAIKVADKFVQGSIKDLGPKDLGYYQPYESDSTGTNLDTIVDWAGLPVDCVSKQSSQAILLTLSANKVLNRDIERGYWEAERLWIKGDFDTVMRVQDKKTCEACGFSEGFYK